MKTSNSIFLFRDAAARQVAGTKFSGLNILSGRVGSSKASHTAGHLARQAVASALMLLMVPLSFGDAFAQDAPPPPPPDYGAQQGSTYQPLPPEELNRLVAPIALYPDSLVAQVLAAATYPAQVANAEQFVQQSGGAPLEQLAQMADQQPWDPSVKALTAFPQVLDNMNRNMDWTTQLGNAYYNQPQDVMGSVQTMRQRAYDAGNLRQSEQLNVVYQPGAIAIEPVNPNVVYLPYYNPWVVYGPPIAPWGGYYYHPAAGIGFGVGLAIGFGVGIGIGAFGHFGWGYHNWAPNWGSRTVVYNHNTYISNSVTVVNHGNYGGFDRNPQARAFNHTQAAQFANVNHTTINNVQVNRTNVNNVNRTNVNNANVRNNNFNANANRGVAPNNAGANFNPRAQQNYNRGAQASQINGANGARPATQTGQFNGARPATQPGQFNGGARPAQSYARTAQPGSQPTQLNGGARPGAPAANVNHGAAPATQQHQPAPQQHAAAAHATPQHESHADSHAAGEHHH